MVTSRVTPVAQSARESQGFYATRHAHTVRTSRGRHKAQASAQGHGGTRARYDLQVVSHIFLSFFG